MQRFLALMVFLLQMLSLPVAAAEGDTVTRRQERLDQRLRQLTSGERPSTRDIRERATGTRLRRVELREKRSQYSGGLKERLAEMQFKRLQRRQQRQSSAS